MGTIKLKYVTLLLVLAVVRGTDAATYVVGDSLGWNIPNGGAATYATWAAQHTYATGDILVFNFTTGAHDVATVKKPSFDSCSSTSPLALQTISPANVTLTTSGTHYFICTFGQHCSKGQKLTVNVTSTSVGPPASPPTAVPPTAATPPPTAATPSTPPTAASPTTPPTAPVPVTPPAASPAPKGSAPAPGPIVGGGPTPAASPAPKGSAPAPGPTVGGGPTPAASPGPGVSAPVPSTGGGPTPPPSPTTATPPGSSTSPPPTGGSVSPPPPSSASRKAVAALAIGLVLAVMGVVC